MHGADRLNLILPEDTDITASDMTIDTLSNNYGEEVFQTLLNNLFNSDFCQQEAKAHWQAAVQHFANDAENLNWRSVLLNYMLSQTDLLNNPCILEIEELQRLKSNAVTDGLTNLYNQSHFKHRLATVIKECEKDPDAVFSLLILDLDHFKQFNDRCGHLRGDHALTKVGKIICAAVPDNAIAARYGGEEFAVILPGTDMSEGIALAEKIRSCIEQTSFDGEERLDKGCLTISGGVACYPAGGKTSIAMIAQADSKLYDAKLSRNSISPRLCDTRNIIRFNFRSIVEFLDHSSGAFKNSLSSDISYTGMLLKSPQPVEVGSNLQLRFPYPFWPTDHTTTGQVRHVRSNSTRGDYLVGLQFLQPQVEFIEKVLPTEVYNAGA